MSDPTFTRPTSDNREQWRAYWTAQGELWRTETEIATERQQELAYRRDTIIPDIRGGIYPFKDFHLARADIEWLLHEHGPIDWTKGEEREQAGLDLRGTLLVNHDNQDPIDLSGLSLAKTQFGLSNGELMMVTLEERKYAEAHLKGSLLYHTHLEGAVLNAAHLEGAVLHAAHLESAFLKAAYLFGADLSNARLDGADLSNAHLESTDLSYAHLEGADLSNSHLEGAILYNAHLEGANLISAHLGGIKSNHGLRLSDYSRAFLDEATSLDFIDFGKVLGTITLADIHWGEVNLAVVSWGAKSFTILGDEVEAQEITYTDGEKKVQAERIGDWEAAVRAYRQFLASLRFTDVAFSLVVLLSMTHLRLLPQRKLLLAYSLKSASLPPSPSAFSAGSRLGEQFDGMECVALLFNPVY